MPKVILESLWETIVLPVMCWLAFMRVSPTQANRPSSPLLRASEVLYSFAEPPTMRSVALGATVRTSSMTAL